MLFGYFLKLLPYKEQGFPMRSPLLLVHTAYFSITRTKDCGLSEPSATDALSLFRLRPLV